MTRINTQNPTIRRAELNDAKLLQSLWGLENAYSNTLQLPFPSEKLWQSRIESFNTENNFCLIALLDDIVVGSIHFYIENSLRRKHVASFGIAVHDSYQGIGIASALMTEMLNVCDNWLAIQRIELTVYADNLAAVSLYSKFGFSVEGKHPAFAFRNGCYVDALSMARIKENSISQNSITK